MARADSTLGARRAAPAPWWVLGTLVTLAGLGATGPAAAMPAGESGVVRFTWPDTSASQVFLAGDFNFWSQTATPLDREGGAWVTRVFLDPGDYEYKFLVDGVWQLDPDNPETSAGGSSVVHVLADGEVGPPQAPAGAAGGNFQPARGDGAGLDWSGRWIGLQRSRLDRDADRWDLARPTHDIDLRLDARIAPEASGWFLAHLGNQPDSLRDGLPVDPPDGDAGGDTELRLERALLQWTPGPWEVRLFQHHGGVEFDDPAALVGRIGLWSHAFGFDRRGVAVRRRLLGAPLDLVYADDLDPAPQVAPPSALPDLHVTAMAPPLGPGFERYVASPSERGGDALALRARGGTDRLGFGASYRLDRGGRPGRVAQLSIAAAGDTLVGSGREFETEESWRAWGLDLRLGWRTARLAAEYLSGSRDARARQQRPVLELRGAAGGAATQRLLGDPEPSAAEFDLDDSRRVLVRLGRAEDAGAPGAAPAPAGPPSWSALPPQATRRGPQLVYEYEEHDFSARIAGGPFLSRRHTLGAGVATRLGTTRLELDLEHHVFERPAAAAWETQDWFEAQNFWLDEDVARFERLTLLGTRRAALAHLRLARTLWPARGLRGELSSTWAGPGFDAAPRHLENVLHLELPLGAGLELAGWSRLSTYRQFDSDDPALQARFGPGPHVVAGDLDLDGVAGLRYTYRSFAAHFVELVYRAGARSDLALGFGVDPIVVYEVANEYGPIGWDTFLFEEGASPLAARLDPAGLGRRILRAERALERERRVQLEARVRF